MQEQIEIRRTEFGFEKLKEINHLEDPLTGVKILLDRVVWTFDLWQNPSIGILRKRIIFFFRIL